MIWKIEIKKVLFVEADSKEEADEMVSDGDEIVSDEVIIKVSKSSRKEVRRFCFNPFGVESEGAE